MSSDPTRPTTDLERTLRERFGLDHFRAGQRDVIAEVLAGRDVLCVMPTGGGKSLCYQLPALLLGQPTLVVSPLIALMKDQVDALHERGIRATLINSSLDLAEQHARLAEVQAGHYDLVYVAPERFRSRRFLDAMNRVRPALLAVDEAHCISEWGHDFRPDYARIGIARRLIGSPPCIALTATATDLVRRDIADQLHLADPAQFVTGFDRPNLSYAVVDARRDADKLVALAGVLERSPGPSVIYASSRARCEAVGQFLTDHLQRPTVVYHAGLTREERTEAQERFMRGEVETVVATNAFGMGVDKANIRSVVHFNLPGTLEAYYQEAGRAGRDGEAARCVLLYAPGDRKLQELFIDNEYPPPEAVYQVYDFLRRQDADPIELTHAEIRESARLDLNESAIGTALKILEGAGAVERFRPRENMAIIRINGEPDDPSLMDRVHPQADKQRLVLQVLEGLVNRRLNEPVYFHPDELAGKIGIERTTLTRAIRALAETLPIDYVPPFRGNAVRVNDRQKRGRDYAIDFQALDQKKQREYDKLDRMVRYATSTRCRRSVILGYFGDQVGSESGHCGRCDNCGSTEDAPRSIQSRVLTSPAAREVVLKALSGVARARGRFGKTLVAQMLIGSNSEKMARFGMSSLSTFGLLGHFRQPEVVRLLDELTVAGLIEAENVNPGRPVVNLTPAGRALFKNADGSWPELRLPDDLFAKLEQTRGPSAPTRSAPPAASAPMTASSPTPARVAPTRRSPSGVAATAMAPAPAADVDSNEIDADLKADPLYETLRALRTGWARELGQSPFTVFSNATLVEIVRVRPATPRDLLGIKGINNYRLDRYGSAILAAINGSAAATAPTAAPADLTTSRPAPVPARSARPTPGQPTSRPFGAGLDDDAPAQVPPATTRERATPTEEWTGRLLDKGFTPEEIAAIRGLPPEQVLAHAGKLAGRGRAVPIEAFVDAEALLMWDERLDAGFTEPMPGWEVAPRVWALFLLCRRRSAT